MMIKLARWIAADCYSSLTKAPYQALGAPDGAPILLVGVDNQAKRKSSTVRLAFMTPASAMLEPSA
jgi:hypothetical protein